MDVIGRPGNIPRRSRGKRAVASAMALTNVSQSAGLWKHGLVAIAAIEDVIPHAGDGGSCGPGHEPIIIGVAALRHIRSVPFATSNVERHHQ